MFGFLKQKLNNFSEKLKNTISGKEQKENKKEETTTKKKETTETKTEEKKKQEKTKIETKKQIEEKIVEKKETKKETTKTLPTTEPKIETKPTAPTKETTTEKKETPQKKGLLEKIFSIGKKESKEKEILQPTEKPKKEIKKEDKPKIEKKHEVKEIKKYEEKELIEEEETKEIESEISEQEQKMEQKRESLKDIEIKSASEDKRELKAKVGVGGKLSGLIFGGVEIKENEISDLLWELELSLLESDVEQDAAHELVEQIKKRLLGQKVSAKNIDNFLNEQIKEILKEMMTTKKIDLLTEIKNKKEKPYKILLLGPNGAGKTTSIGKLTYLLEKNNLKSIWAAGDTFRAAAIDQLEKHAKKLGVRVIKHQYGADPAAVAFDAIKAAEAGGIDVVLMDSAGRQETNKNLMEELRKIERVTKPDLKLYVGEAYAGQGLLDQAKEFDDAIGIDGFILTKIDTDAKGGTTISLLYKLKKPILYIGTGQEYKDFEKFSEEYIINRII